MLSGESLPDPLNADPVSVASRIPLPPSLRAVLLGALDVRYRRHHSAASMAETLRVTMRQLAAPQLAAKRRVHPAVWFAPALGLLAVPAWLALDVSSPLAVCPAAAATVCPTTAAEPASGALDPRSAKPAILAAAPPGLPVSVPPPPATHDPDDVPAHRGPPRRAPFNLDAALAACKPHPTTRLVIAYDPQGPLRINDEAPLGETGRCVEAVLALHPPPRRVTLRP